jgi:hypothetical protein
VSDLVFWSVVGSLLGVILLLLIAACCFLFLRTSSRRKERRALYLERQLQARAIELERFHQVFNISWALTD